MSGSAIMPARILVVDDQDDVRQMLVTALQLDGYRADAAGNAHDGLSRLRESRYDLVLSDYAMPGGTGAWMLREATRAGLLRQTPGVIVTAHPLLEDVSNIRVIPKPLELDGFLDQVRTILAASRRPLSTGIRPSDRKPRRPTRAVARVELVLYVSPSSPASIEARRNVERVLKKFAASQVKLTVCDLVRQPLDAEADRVAFTPTLVKRSPEPKMWILGNLRESEVLSDLLLACGVDHIR